MTKNTSIQNIRILKEFREPIPVELASLGVEVCSKFKSAMDKYNEGLADDEKLDQGEFLVTVLVEALPDWIQEKEKAERSTGRKEGRGSRNVASGPGSGRRGPRPYDGTPQAAE